LVLFVVILGMVIQRIKSLKVTVQAVDLAVVSKLAVVAVQKKMDTVSVVLAVGQDLLPAVMVLLVQY
jgi:hypothetical protein